MSILSTDDKIVYEPFSCKEEFYQSVASHLGWRDSKLKKKAQEVLSGDSVEKGVRIYTRSAKFVFTHTSGGAYDESGIRPRKPREIAERIHDVMEALRKRMKLTFRTKVSYSAHRQTNKISPAKSVYLVNIDRFFLKSPVAISAALTYIRAAIYSDFKFKSDSIVDFTEKLIDYSVNRCKDYTTDYNNDGDEDGANDYDHVGFVAHDDASHLNSALDSEVLEKFWNKTLPCLRRPGMDDCKYYIIDEFSDAYLNGICEYDPDDEYEHAANYIKRVWNEDFSEDDDSEDAIEPEGYFSSWW